MVPEISVIICTYNRSSRLSNVLETLFQQHLSSDLYEVIVVDNNSTDDTAELVRKLCESHLNLRYCFEPNQGLSHARNRGWRESRGTYIAYTDDDCKIPENWLSVAKHVIEEVAPPVFGGPYYPFYDSEKPRWFKDDYGSHTKGDKNRFLEEEYLSGGNLFLLNELIKKVGGFNTSLGMSGRKVGLGEESTLLDSIRAKLGGQSIYYHHNLYVYHLVHPSKFSIRYQLKRSFIGGQTHPSVHTSNLSEVAWVLETMKVVFSLTYKTTLGLMFRNRKRFPFIQNYFVEVIGRTIGGLGRVYEHYKQKFKEI